MHQKAKTTDVKAILSTLWIFILLNVLFRDIHELFRPGLLQEMMTGIVNGNKMTEELLLIAGFVLEIPILMVVLSRILNYKANRWANIVVSIITIPIILANGMSDLDDIFFATVEIAGLITILVYAWKWKHIEYNTNNF